MKKRDQARSVCLMVATVLAFTFTACGGGGGGGGSGDGGSDSADGVRVLHGSIDAAPVDVISSTASSAVVSQATFAGAKGYRSLRSGDQVLSLTRALNSGDVLASFNASIEKGGRYSILLYGDGDTFGLRSRLIIDEVPNDIAGAAVRVVNGVTGAAAISVSISGGGSEQVGFGQNSGYIQTSAGEVTITTSRAADGQRVSSVTRVLQSGRAYTVLVAGEVGYYVKSVLFTDK
ncbi:MAG: hypothetical protein RL326_454 [Pseudomonadota bacterium]